MKKAKKEIFEKYMVNININTENLPQDIISFILSPPKERWLFDLRFSFIAISFFLFVGLIILLFKNAWLKRLFIEDWREFFTWQAFGIKTAEKEWKKIKERLNTGQEPEYKLAIVEADNILNDVLKKMEYGAGISAEVLNILPPAIFPNLEEIKLAHNLHENIVHDPDFRLSPDDAKKAIAAYEKFFIDSEVL